MRNGMILKLGRRVGGRCGAVKPLVVVVKLVMVTFDLRRAAERDDFEAGE